MYSVSNKNKNKNKALNPAAKPVATATSSKKMPSISETLFVRLTFVVSVVFVVTGIWRQMNSMTMMSLIGHEQFQEQEFDSYSTAQEAVASTPIQELTMPYMRKLANEYTFFDEVDRLYNKYGHEIAEYRPVMREWCNHTATCKFGDYEVEMLYMLVREHKPQKVFEASSKKGYAAHWILKALHVNDDTSKLHSFEKSASVADFMNLTYKPRWVYTSGDYLKLYDKGYLNMDQFDLLFFDAPAARGYCKRILANQRRKSTLVVVHDVVGNKKGAGGESVEVYKYLAMAGNAHNVFTMSHYAMPNNLYEPQTEKVVPLMNQMRADMGIVTPCGYNCSNIHHDLLYWDNNDSPAIFFTLN